MSQKIKLASQLTFDSIVDGPGLRTVLWTQGCPHGCKGCHNQETWDFEGGFWEDVDTVIKHIQTGHLQSGLTISGGEPFLQVEPLIELCKAVKTDSFTIWLYSGYTYQQILADHKKRELLEHIDVLVDGLFVASLMEHDLRFRGSANQRMIDVPTSLKQGTVILLDIET